MFHSPSNIFSVFLHSSIGTSVKHLFSLLSSMHSFICSYHVKYTFQSESTLHSCLNVKELLAQNRRKIWSLSDCNGIRTHNHLVHKRTLNHLVKLPTGWVFVYELSGCGFDSRCRHSFILLITRYKRFTLVIFA